MTTLHDRSDASIGKAVKHAFARAIRGGGQVNFKIIGDDEEYSFNAMVSVWCYENGFLVVTADRSRVIPYSSLLWLEAVVDVFLADDG